MYTGIYTLYIYQEIFTVKYLAGSHSYENQPHEIQFHVHLNFTVLLDGEIKMCEKNLMRTFLHVKISPIYSIQYSKSSMCCNTDIYMYILYTVHAQSKYRMARFIRIQDWKRDHVSAYTAVHVVTKTLLKQHCYCNEIHGPQHTSLMRRELHVYVAREFSFLLSHTYSLTKEQTFSFML